MVEQQISDPLELHRLVWKNEPQKIDHLLSNDTGVRDLHDQKHGHVPFIDRPYRGMSPLTLAVQLGREECVRVLLRHNADTLSVSDIGFFPLMDATALGNRTIMQDILLRRHEQIRQLWLVRQPFVYDALLHDIPDFYVELHWQFKSWIPFVSMLCPSDRYRIWKRGSRLRVDTTLVGFEGMRWIRGNVSYIFKVGERNSQLFLLDHDRALWEEVSKLEDYSGKDVEEDLNMRLNTEIVTVKVQKEPDGRPGSKNVIFERQRSGPFGIGGPKDDLVAGFWTSVYDVRDIDVVTKTRREHLRDRPKGDPTNKNDLTVSDILEKDEKDLQSISPNSAEIEGYLQEAKKLMYNHVPSLPPPPPPSITYEEYFGGGSSYVHLGRPLALHEKTKTFKLALWMAQKYPITVAQLLPIFEILSPTNRHVEKLREFISMDLPPGFPVQVELPLFAVLTAQVTFRNFAAWPKQGKEGKVSNVPHPQSVDKDAPEGLWFAVPETYQPGIVIKNIFKRYDDDN